MYQYLVGMEDENILGSGDEDDDEIEVTAQEVYEKLKEAWLNEKFSPELLESKIELVDCMLVQVKEIENGMSDKSKTKDLVSSLQKIELERVKFVIASYLRERLKKIEANVIHVLEQEGNGAGKLSAEELVFAKTFADNLQKHFNTLALQHMPENMQKLDEKKNIPRPNTDAYVLVKVNERQDQVLLDPDDEPVDLDPGTIHCVRYQPVASLIDANTVSLI